MPISAAPSTFPFGLITNRAAQAFQTILGVTYLEVFWMPDEVGSGGQRPIHRLAEIGADSLLGVGNDLRT